MANNIKNLVKYYVNTYKTNNPFELADYLKIVVQKGILGDYYGCYMYLKKHRCIFLNSDLNPFTEKMVMAHELGHAILHIKVNCCFMKNKTLLSTTKIERQANLFATELLLPDKIIVECFEKGYTLDQIAEEHQVHKEFVLLKLEGLSNYN